MADLQTQLNDTLILMSYHDTRMGTPADYFTPAIAWRSEKYYLWNMGGASINGNGIGNYANGTADSLRLKQIDQYATFNVSSTTLNYQRLSAEISVKVTAAKDLPAGIRFHAAVVETNLDVVAVYGQATGNGQRYIYNIVRDLLTDSAGIAIAALTTGQSDSITKIFVRNPAIQNADSLRVVAWLQNESTKQIIAAMQTYTSAIPPSTSILATSTVAKSSKLRVANSGRNRVCFVMPFDGLEAAVYNTTGRNCGSFTLNSKKGETVSITVPQSKSILFLKVVSVNGSAAIAEIVSP